MLRQIKPRHTLRKRRSAPATPLAQNYAVFPGNVALGIPAPCADPFLAVLRARPFLPPSIPASIAQALRRIHSRALCACFVAALIGTAAHFRKPSGSFILVRRARASSTRSSEPPSIPASAAQALRRLYQGAQPFAVGSLRRRAYRFGGLAYQPIFQLRVARVEAPRRDGQRAHRARAGGRPGKQIRVFRFGGAF